MKKRLGEDKEKLYRMRVYPIETDIDTIEWVAEFPDLPGCVGAGDTAEEAVLMATDAKKAWIEIALEDGKNIPDAKNLYGNDYSGKFTLRLPKTLHKELTLQADDEGVSLNQYILYLMTKGLNKEKATTIESVEKVNKFITSAISLFQDAAIKPWNVKYLSEEISFAKQKDFKKEGRYKYEQNISTSVN